MGASNCSSLKVPRFTAKLWAGSSEVEGIERRQVGEIIKASDPAFDDYICMQGEDFTDYIMKVATSCEVWKFSKS